MVTPHFSTLRHCLLCRYANKEFFRSVKVAYGTVIWPHDIDYCPDTLTAKVIQHKPHYSNTKTPLRELYSLGRGVLTLLKYEYIVAIYIRVYTC